MFPWEHYCPQCGMAVFLGATVCSFCREPLHLTPPSLVTPLLTSPSLQTRAGPTHQLLQGRYRLTRQIGAGGFGAVYEAEDLLEQRRVAIKQTNLLGLSSAQVSEATNVFEREARLLALLHHQSIPQLYARLQESEHCYLVMEFIDGQTLEEYLARVPSGRLPPEQALTICIQLCYVLDYLHRRQPAIIFRDLKPTNILLTPAGKPGLVDFGAAREYVPGKIKDTIAFGSPGYAAPEQYGSAQTTPRADIYSLGALLHQLLTGQDPSLNPFCFQPIRSVQRSLPDSLEQLLACMLDRDVQRRPPDVEHVRRALQSIASSPRIARPRPATRAQPSSTSARVHAFSARGVLVSRYRGHLSPVSALAWSPDGQAIVSVEEAWGYAMWDVFRSPTRVRLLVSRAWATGIRTLAWSPDGRTLATAGGQAGVCLWPLPAAPRWWQVWALHAGLDIHRYTGHATPVAALSWAPTGHAIASVERNGTIHIWDTTTRELLGRSRHHTDTVEDLAWSPDGLRIASTSLDQTVQVRRIDGGRQLWKWTVERDAVAHTLNWSPDARYLACGLSSGLVRVWDLLQERKVSAYYGQKRAVTAVVWSPDGTLLASASLDGTVHLWHALSGKALFVYRGHKESVMALAWSPDGQHLASAGLGAMVHVWKTH